MKRLRAERGGGQEREVNATPSHSALQFTRPSFKWVCAEKTTSLGSVTGSAYNVDGHFKDFKGRRHRTISGVRPKMWDLAKLLEGDLRA